MRTACSSALLTRVRAAPSTGSSSTRSAWQRPSRCRPGSSRAGGRGGAQRQRQRSWVQLLQQQLGAGPNNP